MQSILGIHKIRTPRSLLAGMVFIAVGSVLSGCNYPMRDIRPPARQVTSLELTLAYLDRETPLPAASTPGPQASLSSPPEPFNGLQTATPAPPGQRELPMPTVGSLPDKFDYLSQSGDTVEAVAARFEVEPQEVILGDAQDPSEYLDPGTLMTIPNLLTEYSYPEALFPDSEVIYSPSALDTDLEDFISTAGGYLSGYLEMVGPIELTGAEIVQRVAVERSSNPRLLLAFLEYRSNWVYGQPANPGDVRYPIGFNAPGYQGLYDELTLVANHLNIGFYNWRSGDFNLIRFEDGERVRQSPFINAGTAAVNNLFAKFYAKEAWEQALYGADNFQTLYRDMFGNPWQLAAQYEPLLDSRVVQPDLELPFSAGESWSFTGGPHRTLTLGSPIGALDFSPVTGEAPCAVSRTWVTAPAAGVVTRSGEGTLALDLDGDGDEGTGWVLFFLHIASQSSREPGTRVEKDEPLGHPSCEGGNATGTHVHIARKYDGEWLAADGPVPFVLSGWRVERGERIYEGSLHRDGNSVYANPGGSQTSIVSR